VDLGVERPDLEGGRSVLDLAGLWPELGQRGPMVGPDVVQTPVVDYHTASDHGGLQRPAGEAVARQRHRQRGLTLGDDLGQVWNAPTTTSKDRMQLLHTLLGEVAITVHRDHTEGRADLVLRWKGGAISELTVPLKRKPPKIRTSEDTIDLVRRLAVHYPDAKIAGILNQQQRHTARGMSFTASRVQSLRHHWHISCHQPSGRIPEGELPISPRSRSSVGPPSVASSTNTSGLHRSPGQDRWPSSGTPQAAGPKRCPGAQKRAQGRSLRPPSQAHERCRLVRQ